LNKKVERQFYFNSLNICWNI